MSTATELVERWQTALDELPLIAILRGLSAAEAVDVGSVLFNCGFRLLEVPLNSPDPFRSVELLSQEFANRAIIGTGTVLNPLDVAQSVAAGAELIIAPNLDLDVAKAAEDANSIYCPGVATPSEAFAALKAGADALKLFPAEMLTPTVLKALRAVLPTQCCLLPVGGITPDAMQHYLRAGANGFGIGSALYKPGKSLSALQHDAEQFVASFKST